MSADLALDRRGHGEPLLLLHGLWHHRHAWKRIVPLLSDRFDVITVDLPGFAESVHVPGAPRKVPDIARFIADRFDSWDVDRPHVVGNSLGGAIALELASDGHARSVTALSPAGFLGPFNRLQTVGVLAALRMSRVALPLAWQHAAAQREFGRRLHALGIYDKGTTLTAEEAICDAVNIKHVPLFEAVLLANLTYSHRGSAKVPTTIAWGANDRILPVGSLRRVAAKVPGAHLQVLPGCGHAPMVDDPHSVAAAIISTTKRTS